MYSAVDSLGLALLVEHARQREHGLLVALVGLVGGAVVLLGGVEATEHLGRPRRVEVGLRTGTELRRLGEAGVGGRRSR